MKTMVSVKKVSDFVYHVNDKVVAMNDDGVFVPVSDEVKLLKDEQSALEKFIISINRKLRIQSTVR